MGAKMFDISTMVKAGIDPKTKMPVRSIGEIGDFFHENIKRNLRIIDEQDAVNRFTWYNLPDSLSGELLERILYYRGSGMFFYMETNDTFYFLPYALDGTIDAYGRYNSITPLALGKTFEEKGNKEIPLIQGLSYNVIKEIPFIPTADDFLHGAVILWDYTKQMSENIIPRSVLNDCLVNAEAEMISLLRTSMINGAGVKGLRVEGEDEQSNVSQAQRQYYNAAITGKSWVALVGHLDFQELDTNTAKTCEEYLQVIQSLDNLRLQTYGVENGGIFEKQGTIIQSEANFAYANCGLIMQDGLRQRQRFCNIINQVFGLSVWCEITQDETAFEGNEEQENNDELDTENLESESVENDKPSE